MLNETELKLLPLKKHELVYRLRDKEITEEEYVRETEKFDIMLHEHLQEVLKLNDEKNKQQVK